MSGKGDKRRPGKPGAYEEGYDAINWGKDLKHPPVRTVAEIIAADRERFFNGDNSITTVTGQYIAYGTDK